MGEILLGRRYRRTRRVAASRGGSSVHSGRKGNAGYPLPSTPNYTAQRACGKPRVVLYNRRPMARTYGNASGEMRVLSSTYGSRGNGEPMVGLAVRLRALGAEGCDALAAGGVVPAGVWL